MRNWKLQARLFGYSLLETLWAISANYVGGKVAQPA